MQPVNTLLLSVAQGKQAERIPVWLMRQAGRVLPEYRKLRQSVKDFKTLVKTPELAAEITLQPVSALGVDAAIIFSDILVVPEAMGLPYEMREGEGPRFPATVATARDLKKLRVAEAGDLDYVMRAIKLVRSELLNGSIPLIGFAGAPWTILAYMVEGQGSKTFSRAKSLIYEDPATAHALLDMITKSTTTYLKGQVQAGAEIVQLFDTWAGILGPAAFGEFSLPYMQRICNAITEVPKIVFSKGANFFEKLNETNSEVISLDWTADVVQARKLMPGKVLQGNLDPAVLYADYNVIRKETRKMLDAFGPDRYIANLGHGLYPDTDVDSVKCFVNAVREYGELMMK